MSADVDIDFADRTQILDLIAHVPAMQANQGKERRHNSGIYVTDIPYDPINQCAAIDYTEAEERGYFKLDFLNVSVYQQVKSEQHLLDLMHEPDWTKLYDRAICSQLIHINNHHDPLLQMPEPEDTIPRLAMFLAVIRPGKKHLIGKTWKEVAETVWDKTDKGYSFKRAHGVSYSQLVVVHMNLLAEQEQNAI